MPVEYVPISSIEQGWPVRQGSGTDGAHVRVLAEADAPLPPIIVHRPTMRVIDGGHRWEAARVRREDRIAVRYFDGDTEDAFALAVLANAAHGLPLTLAERKSAAARLIRSHPHWSDRLIAETAGLSHVTVGAIRGRDGAPGGAVAGRIGRDGKVRRPDALERRRAAAEFVRARPAASIREISRTARISLGTAKDVRDRVLGAGTAGSGRDRLQPVGIREGAPDIGAVAWDETDAATAPPVPVQQAILQTMRNDPALKFTDRGRALLRRLSMSTMSPRVWDEIAVDVPGHCIESLVKLARANAESWNELARRLEDGRGAGGRGQGPVGRRPGVQADRITG